jgi:predicted TPR repeat methyltransferase
VVEVRFFEEGTIPECTTPGWYEGREHAPHLEEYGHRDRLLQASAYARQAAASYGLSRIVDMGAGDGGLLSTLTDLPIEFEGYDLQKTNVDAALANRGLHLSVRDIVANPPDWFDNEHTGVLATEMLEHLVDPHGFLRSIPAKVIVASSPWSETVGPAYEFHTWAWDNAGYRALLEQAGFEIVAQNNVSIFQVWLAARP